jgi:membrane protein
MEVKSAMGRIVRVFKDTVTEWTNDSASSRAAALSYYSALSISPLLIIAIAIAGLVFGPDHVRGQVMAQIQGLVGVGGADVIDSMLRSTNSTSGGVIATVVGLATLFLGASGVFIELEDALNKFWGAEPQQGSGLWGFVRTRLLSFAMVLGIGFLMLVSLLLSAALAALGKFIGGLIPAFEITAHIINAVLSLGIVTVLFALIFKVLPNVRLHWRDVWTGAFTTSVLFTVGKFLIGFYLGRASTASPYGAAGSVIVILLWVYYSALILYFGAEFTKVYARQHGSHQPKYGTVEAKSARPIARKPPYEPPPHSDGPARHVPH